MEWNTTQGRSYAEGQQHLAPTGLRITKLITALLLHSLVNTYLILDITR